VSGHYDLRGRVVLITGPARGIGAATARDLARRGARLALVGLEPEKLAALAEELGPNAAWWEADVTDTEALQAAVAAAVERFGGIDVAMANAGIYRHGTVTSIEAGDFERVIEVNLLGVWRTARATLPHLLAGRGYFLICSSLAAAVHAPMMAAYSTTKAGVEAFGDSLRAEVGHRGVDVGVAYFSFIDTDMTTEAFSHPSTQGMRQGIGARLTRTLPVRYASKSVVRGMERRAKRIVVPRALTPLVLAPGLFAPVLERVAHKQTIEGVDRFDALSSAADAPPAPRS
jgi:NAD(P)-dependent dehydrogenase (short-subunit alcohol dehydrogenase family)